MFKSIATATLLAMLVFVPVSQAQTADEMTPAEETGCDDLDGVLFGLCNAYCEAMDCHLEVPFASERACERVLTQYMTHSEGEMPPCHGFTGDDDGSGDSGEPGDGGDNMPGGDEEDTGAEEGDGGESFPQA